MKKKTKKNFILIVLTVSMLLFVITVGYKAIHYGDIDEIKPVCEDTTLLDYVYDCTDTYNSATIPPTVNVICEYRSTARVQLSPMTSSECAISWIYPDIGTDIQTICVGKTYDDALNYCISKIPSAIKNIHIARI